MRKIPRGQHRMAASAYEKKLAGFEIAIPRSQDDQHQRRRHPPGSGVCRSGDGACPEERFLSVGDPDLDPVPDRPPRGIDERAIGILGTPEFFFKRSPLSGWGPTPSSPNGGKELGKGIPPLHGSKNWQASSRERGIRHFHYWIASDFDSTWPEFIAEVLLILSFRNRFPGSDSWPMRRFWSLIRALRSTGCCRQGHDGQLRLKKTCPLPVPEFAYPLVASVETRFPHLNRLLATNPILRRVGEVFSTS